MRRPQAAPAPQFHRLPGQGREPPQERYGALAAIDEQLLPVLKTKKYVVIKTNFVSTTNQLAASHTDAVHGILDYLEPRFKGPVLIAESSAGDTMDGFEQFGYNRLAAERKQQKVQLLDLNARKRTRSSR